MSDKRSNRCVCTHIKHLDAIPVRCFRRQRFAVQYDNPCRPLSLASPLRSPVPTTISRPSHHQRSHCHQPTTSPSVPQPHTTRTTALSAPGNTASSADIAHAPPSYTTTPTTHSKPNNLNPNDHLPPHKTALKFPQTQLKPKNLDKSFFVVKLSETVIVNF